MKPPSPWRRAWYVGTVVGLIAAVAVPSWLAVDARERAQRRAATEDRVEHVLMYELGDGAPPPRLPLLGDERALYLGTIARWPTGLAATEVATYELEVTVTGAAAPWHRTVALQTRQAVAADVRLAGAATTPLGEERNVTVSLPPLQPGAVVTIRATAGAALLRVLSIQPRRHPDEQVDRLTTEAAASLLGDATIEPWSMLDASERAALVGTLRRKVSPLGEDGVNYRAQAVLVRHRATRPAGALPAAAPGGFDVEADRAYALNVRGPVRLRLDLAARPDEPPATAPRADELAVEVDALDVATGTHTHHHVDASGADLELPDGLHGLTITTPAPALRLRVTAPHAAQVAAAPAGCDAAGTSCELRPDTTRLPIEVTGPGLAPLEVQPGAAVAATPAGALGRVTLRALDPPRDGTPAPVEVRLQFRDAADQPVGDWAQQLAFVDDPFVRYRDATGATRRASAPRALTVATPPRTTRVIVTTSAATAVRLERSLGQPDALAPPYRDAPPGVARWRYAPRATVRWLGFWSDVGRPPLIEQYLEAQVRLAEPEPGLPAVGPDRDLVAVGLVPRDAAAQRVLREPVPPARAAAVLASWPDGAVAVMRVGAPLRVEVPRAPTAPTRIDYEVAAAAVDAEVAVDVDGVEVLRTRLAAPRGAFDVPALRAGPHVVTVRTGVAAQLTINRAPLDPGVPLQRRRTVYGLDGGPMHVRVRSQPGERVVVNVVAYGPPTIDGAVLRYTIDGGRRPPRPGVVEGAFTATDRRLRLPRAGASAVATFVDGVGDTAGRPRTVAIPLGADLGDGTHEIDLYAARGQRLWLRFFVYTYRDASRTPELQRGIGEDDEPTP